MLLITIYNSLNIMMEKLPYWLDLPLPYGDISVASTKTYWHHSDSETHYGQIRTAMPREWWGHGLIEYAWNSWGYRGPEITEDLIAESVVITGCSHVVGLGLPWDSTIGQQLSRHLKCPVINLGLSGSSPRWAAMLNLQLSRGRRPRAVINLWSSPERTTYWGSTQPSHLGPWSRNPHDEGYYRYLTEDPAMTAVDFYMTREMTRSLWPNTQYAEGTVFKATGELGVRLFGIEDRARDLGHIGPVTARRIAETLARELIT